MPGPGWSQKMKEKYSGFGMDRLRQVVMKAVGCLLQRCLHKDQGCQWTCSQTMKWYGWGLFVAFTLPNTLDQGNLLRWLWRSMILGSLLAPGGCPSLSSCFGTGLVVGLCGVMVKSTTDPEKSHSGDYWKTAGNFRQVRWDLLTEDEGWWSRKTGWLEFGQWTQCHSEGRCRFQIFLQEHPEKTVISENWKARKFFWFIFQSGLDSCLDWISCPVFPGFVHFWKGALEANFLSSFLKTNVHTQNPSEVSSTQDGRDGWQGLGIMSILWFYFHWTLFDFICVQNNFNMMWAQTYLLKSKQWKAISVLISTSIFKNQGKAEGVEWGQVDGHQSNGRFVWISSEKDLSKVKTQDGKNSFG